MILLYRVQMKWTKKGKSIYPVLNRLNLNILSKDPVGILLYGGNDIITTAELYTCKIKLLR